jgi:WD40 repeat protein/DNA-binding SARP family transcriptional activator
MSSSRFEFRILGPLDVREDAVSVRIGGPKQRALLALLLLSANRVVSRDRLIGELLPDQSVNSADHALRVQVWRLRNALGRRNDHEPRLVARAPGYLLRVEPGELDLEVFEQQVVEGRDALADGRAEDAARALRAAASLWRGRPLADLEFEPFARLEVERLEELRLTAVEDRIEAELALGRQAAVIPELESLVAEHPFRERLRGQLMLALYRCGRQVDGLAVYRETRMLLNDELGLEPGVELQELERAILVHDTALEATKPPASVRTPPASRSALRSVCPFKGLVPFEAADAEFFFGRERLIDELVARLVGPTLLCVIGPSGSGKSSLLRAGLLPALASGALPGSDRWRQVVLRPGSRPTERLVEAVGAQLQDVLGCLGAGERLVVGVDQLEELFAPSVDEDERRSFVDVLVEAAWDPEGRAIILPALRADFFGRLAPYADLAELVGGNHVLLGPMSERELRRAIEGPAERAGLLVEPDLVETLVDDVAGEAGGLPLLSTALLELWQGRKDNTLRLATYERMGRVQGAVARLAEAAYFRLEAEQQELARVILLRLAGDDDGIIVRRRVTLEELDIDRDSRVARIVAVLADSRLLTVSEGAVEVAHEALLTHWPRLREWLEEDTQGRYVHRHLMQAATEWDHVGRDAGELYRGARLAVALDWASGHPFELNRTEREYLEESRLASIREVERQRRANRRLRASLLAVLVILAFAVAAGLLALQQRSHARSEATAAEAQRLGAQALIEPALDRSLLLAREGVNLDDSLATRSNLLAALLRSPAALSVAHAGGARVLDEALSSDGRTLAVRGDDGGVVFFDARTLRQVAKLPGSDQIGLMGATVGPLHALAFSPDGKTVGVGSTTGHQATLEIVDTRTHLVRARAIDAYLHAADVAFSPDGRMVAVGEPVTGMAHPPDEVIVVHDATTARIRAASQPIPAGRLAGYTSDGRFLLVTEGDAASLLLDARTLKPVKTIRFGGAAALSPIDDEAAFGQRDGSVTFVDLRTSKQRLMTGRAIGSIQAISFSADGTRLATAAEGGTIAVWDTNGGLRETFHGHSADARAAVFSPDARTLFTAGSDGSVIAWDVGGSRRLGQPFRFALTNDGASTASAVSPDGTVYATLPDEGHVTLWHTRTLKRLPGALQGPVGHVNSLAFSHDGKLLAAAGSDRAVVWDAATTEITRVLPVAEFGANAIAFSPHGLTLAMGQSDGSDVIYDLRTGDEVVRFANAGSTDSIDFSPDGELLASASLDGSVTVWDVNSKEAVAGLRGPVPAFAVRFSPDGKLVAVGDSSGAVVLWDVARRRRTGRALTGHNGGVRGIAFDPSGRTLVTSSSDGKLRLWDVKTRKLIGAPLPGSTVAGSTAFFPDGTHVLGVFGSGTGIVWNIDPEAWKATACRIAHRELTRTEWDDFLPDRRYRNVCP